MKLNKIIQSVVVLVIVGCFASFTTTDSKASDVIYSGPYSILNITTIGYSDGYLTKIVNGVEKQVFVGTNHYKAQLEVKNQNKKVLIDITYSITDPKLTGTKETPEKPSSIVIGEYILSGSSNFDDRYVKNTSSKELAQVKSIGLSKEEFDKILKNQFKKVTYI